MCVFCGGGGVNILSLPYILLLLKHKSICLTRRSSNNQIEFACLMNSAEENPKRSHCWLNLGFTLSLTVCE